MSATVFDTPLDRRSLIEASAGTGKTYALAGLFARAVIVGRLRVPQILAVTYTIAATQELHARVRARLRSASELADAWRAGDPAERSGDPSECALLRRLLHEALDDATNESLPMLRLRLAAATRDMDLAAIATIHGFCQRLLTEHALEAAQPLLANQLIPDNAAQRHALAVALWRLEARDADRVAFLQRRFGSIDVLARAMPVLLSADPLLPPPPVGDACAERDARWRELHATFAQTGDEARSALQAAVRDRVISSAKDKAIPLDALWRWLGAGDSVSPVQAHAQLVRLGRDWLQSICLQNKQAQLPELPLCNAVDRYLRADDDCDLQRLHALRVSARAQDAANKRAFGYRDFDDLIDVVHDALVDPSRAAPLAAALRAQYPLVLVDEFQDTDARQWAIFERLFGEGGLLLVGDPKQAIYRFRGGDVETYLLARGSAQLATPLRHNYRARPCVLAVVNALFGSATGGALGDGIAFERNLAGRDASCDAHLLFAGQPAAALTFHRVPPRRVQKGAGQEDKSWSKPESIRIAARLCADAIADLLRRARDGQAVRIDALGHPQPLQPRDCAVLVRTHGEALAMRAALASRGVPAVSAGRGSVFATGSANGLLALLLALAAPGEDRRLRAALVTPLFGFDAAALGALDTDGASLLRWQTDFARWRAVWEQHGPQPMLADVLAGQAQRLLLFADGERDLTTLLQLGELMQEARATRLGIQGQLDWLRAAIAHADADDETQQARLESDAGRVQILTLHTSKGLEFPLVYLPFAGIGRSNGRGKDSVSYHTADGTRVRQWKTRRVPAGVLTWEEACARAGVEEQAEDMRLLYVGLTRAREALWLCGGALSASANTALSRLLGGATPGASLIEALGSQMIVGDGLPDANGERLAPDAAPSVPAARTPQRVLRRDWWTHSFSQLHRQQSQARATLVEEAPADDERPLASLVPSGPARFGGTRFGNALHQTLEHVDFAPWRGAPARTPPPGQLEILATSLREHDYAQADIEDGVRELSALVAHTLNAPLPLHDGQSLRLCDVPARARVAELEFHFTLDDVDASALLMLLHEHGIAKSRDRFGGWPRLQGLMNGKIDLTCHFDGRLYVLDYKSNRLPDYEASTLRQAMAASEYDLQALLYVVAAHRWLRLRRGDQYDYVRDMGGALYLFCRGLDATEPGRGVVAMPFPAELVTAADALFAPAKARA
jgi:exodeoxyribonuclease V beta subunit